MVCRGWSFFAAKNAYAALKFPASSFERTAAAMCCPSFLLAPRCLLMDGSCAESLRPFLTQLASYVLVDDIAKISFSSSAFWLSENDGRKWEKFFSCQLAIGWFNDSLKDIGGIYRIPLLHEVCGWSCSTKVDELLHQRRQRLIMAPSACHR